MSHEKKNHEKKKQVSKQVVVDGSGQITCLVIRTTSGKNACSSNYKQNVLFAAD